MDGTSFQGTVEIQGDAARSANTIRYNSIGKPVRVTAADLRAACSAALGTKLTSVQFTSIPYGGMGQFYTGYVAPTQPGTLVETGVSYYDASFPGLDQFYFVPAAGAWGTTTIRYTGTDLKGGRFEGTVEITVAPAQTQSRFTDMDKYGWAKEAVEYLYQNDITKGLSATKFGPEKQIKRGDFVLMLCRAFDFKDSGSAPGFPGVPASSYYAWAVASAREQNVVQGSGGKFMPESPLTRQDAMVMIQRAMSASGWSLPGGGDISYYQDSYKVADYARGAVAALVQLRIISGNDKGELSPTAPISRAEMALILYRVLTL